MNLSYESNLKASISSLEKVIVPSNSTFNSEKINMLKQSKSEIFERK